jgi:hypothetical protein
MAGEEPEGPVGLVRAVDGTYDSAAFFEDAPLGLFCEEAGELRPQSLHLRGGKMCGQEEVSGPIIFLQLLRSQSHFMILSIRVLRRPGPGAWSRGPRPG